MPTFDRRGLQQQSQNLNLNMAAATPIPENMEVDDTLMVQEVYALIAKSAEGRGAKELNPKTLRHPRKAALREERPEGVRSMA